ARNAALWILGDRLRGTWCVPPMMPTTLVAPFSMRSGPLSLVGRSSSAASRLLRRPGLELLEALREEVMPAVGDPNEIEGVAVGRLERRLDGRGAGVGDR